jgi:hypothetical protein
MVEQEESQGHYPLYCLETARNGIKLRSTVDLCLCYEIVTTMVVLQGTTQGRKTVNRDARIARQRQVEPVQVSAGFLVLGWPRQR